MRIFPEQVLFSTGSPLATALGLNLLGFGSKTTATKRTFDEMPPWSLPFWSLNYVSRGGGWAESDAAGRTRVRAGEFLLRFPGEPCRYGPTAGGTWDEYWLLFDGELPRRLREEGIVHPAHPVWRPSGPLSPLVRRFAKAWREGQRRPPSQVLFVRLLLDLLLGPGPGQAVTRVGPADTPERRLYDLLRERCAETPEKVMAFAGALGPYHNLRRRFRRRYGLAPHQAQIEFRLQEARRLLLTTQVPLSTLSSRVGMEDVSYFIRLFRRRFGCTPARLRRDVQENS